MKKTGNSPRRAFAELKHRRAARRSDNPRRVILKLSGEALKGGGPEDLSVSALESIAGEIMKIRRRGVQVAIVIGGGNIWRGAKESGKRGIDRVTADYMGMLATIINALALQDTLERSGVPSRVQSAIEIAKVAEPYIRRRAVRHLEKGRVVIFAAGTGNPYLTTDTTAAMRAAEIGARVILKATKVDGVYTADPLRHPNAHKFVRLSFSEALRRGLQVIDAAALSLCRENHIPVRVFDMNRKGNIARAALGAPIGTLIGD